MQLLFGYEIIKKFGYGVLSCKYFVYADKRLFDPLAKKSCAHCRLGLIQHPQQRTAFFARSHGLAQFKAASCIYVYSEIHARIVAVYLIYIRKVYLLRLRNIAHYRAKRTCSWTVLVKQRLIELVFSEMRAEFAVGVARKKIL